MFISEIVLMRMQALCMDSWGLKEGHQLDGDEKRQRNYRRLPRPKEQSATEEMGGRIWVAEGVSGWIRCPVRCDYERINWHNPLTLHTAP